MSLNVANLSGCLAKLVFCILSGNIQVSAQSSRAEQFSNFKQARCWDVCGLY